MEIRTTTSDGTTTVMDYNLPKLGDPCCKCGEKPGVIEVYGMPGTVSYWCEICLVRECLDGARKQAATIPALEAKLARLIDG